MQYISYSGNAYNISRFGCFFFSLCYPKTVMHHEKYLWIAKEIYVSFFFHSQLYDVWTDMRKFWKVYLILSVGGKSHSRSSSGSSHQSHSLPTYQQWHLRSNIRKYQYWQRKCCFSCWRQTVCTQCCCIAYFFPIMSGNDFWLFVWNCLGINRYWHQNLSAHVCKIVFIFRYENVVLPEHIVLKVFKTSLTSFKNREMYINADYRFKNRISKNSTKVSIEYVVK